MHSSVFARKLHLVVAVLAVVILVLVPFHALLTVWAASVTGHYTAWRLWKEYILVVLTVWAACRVVTDAGLRVRLRRSWLIRLIAAYAAVQLLWGVAAYMHHNVTAFALGYGWLDNVRFLVLFVDMLIVASATPWLRALWPKMVFWPAAAVAAFGLLQYFILPYDFLRHFGYNAATIFPYEDINHNVHYIRVMSSLRGANPLGAYLVVVLSLLGAYWIGRKTVHMTVSRKSGAAWWLPFLAAASAVSLVLTFSRAAWLGLLFALLCLGWLLLRSSRARMIVAAIASAGLLVATGLTLLLRHNTTFQNVVFHTQEHSAVATTSNQGHASALQAGIQDIVHEPFGRGPGTAGPASAYNTGQAPRIAENYFIQVAQEAGWLGLGLFLAINGLVAYRLLQLRRDALSLGLLAAWAGICVVNLLSHAWTDDTLAYLWWGLAGIALAPAKAAVDAASDKH